MPAPLRSERRGRRARAVVAAALSAGLVVGMAGCGGSDEPSAAGSASSAPAGSSSSAPAGSSSSASETVSSPAEAVDGAFLCAKIKSIQADLLAGAPAAAYQAQFVLGIASLLEGPGKAAAYRAGADDAAKASCPTEYATFLQQAEISGLANL